MPQKLTHCRHTHLHPKVCEAGEQPTLKSTLHGAAKSKVKEQLSLNTAKVKTDSAVWCVCCRATQPPKQQTSQVFVRGHKGGGSSENMPFVTGMLLLLVLQSLKLKTCLLT